jgi:hypothetical protein
VEGGREGLGVETGVAAAEAGLLIAAILAAISARFCAMRASADSCIVYQIVARIRSDEITYSSWKFRSIPGILKVEKVIESKSDTDLKVKNHLGMNWRAELTVDSLVGL